MGRIKKTVNGGYQILDFDYANLTTTGIIVEGTYSTIRDSVISNKPLMVKNVILVDSGVEIEDNFADVVKVGTTFYLSMGTFGDKTYTISVTNGNTCSYLINDNVSQTELDNVSSLLDKAINNEASPFDETSTYSEGEFVIYEGQLYKCIIEVETPGAFDINNWDTLTVGNELTELDDSISAINSNLSALGKYVWVSEESLSLYRIPVNRICGSMLLMSMYGLWFIRYIGDSEGEPTINYTKLHHFEGAEILSVSLDTSNKILTVDLSSTQWGGVQAFITTF